MMREETACPVCGAFNECGNMNETDGWMTCVNCRSTVRITENSRYVNADRGGMCEFQILIPLPRK